MPVGVLSSETGVSRVTRGRAVLGLLAGLILVASSGMHSLAGWPQMRAGLARVGAPADLVRGLAVGWYFGGLSILTFGVIAIWLFADALRGRLVPLRPLVVIAVAYAAFGVAAFVVSGRDPFFFIFIVPGLMLLAAAWERHGGGATA